MRIQDNPLLRELTTLRLGGAAVALVDVESVADLESLPERIAHLGGRPVCMGRGSNVLAEDKPLPLTLVRAACKAEPMIVGREGDAVRVRAEAGLALPRLLAWAARQGLSGLEGLSGVPGHVGGGAAMNAGSYGMDFGGVLVSMRVFGPKSGLRVLKKGDFVPEYREMRLPVRGDDVWQLVWDVDLTLQPDKPDAIEERMRDYLERKRSTQPVAAHSAGCVFRNPEGVSAGKLLDEAGFRGKRLGGMGFSALHANFLVNERNGTSDEALELIALAEQAVRERCGVRLRREVHVWLSS